MSFVRTPAAVVAEISGTAATALVVAGCSRFVEGRVQAALIQHSLVVRGKLSIGGTLSCATCLVWCRWSSWRSSCTSQNNRKSMDALLLVLCSLSSTCLGTYFQPDILQMSFQVFHLVAGLDHLIWSSPRSSILSTYHCIACSLASKCFHNFVFLKVTCWNLLREFWTWSWVDQRQGHISTALPFQTRLA